MDRRVHQGTHGRPVRRGHGPASGRRLRPGGADDELAARPGRQRGLDGALLTGRQFYQTDYTKPLLFMSDGAVLEDRAKAEHLLGDQWGMMNETGSYPGQVWLWLYTFWYQIEPFKSSDNADALVWGVMALLTPRVRLHPVHPGPALAPATAAGVPAGLARLLPARRTVSAGRRPAPGLGAQSARWHPSGYGSGVEAVDRSR